jgi:RNA recognition motif-containing protein
MVNCVLNRRDSSRAEVLFFPSLPPAMSIRLYVGNLPQTFDAKELEALFESIGAGVRFKAVNDRDTGACRGFGFANVDDNKLADAVIDQLNGREFGGSTLRIEVSERRDSRPSNAPAERRSSNSTATPASRKPANKLVHSDTVDAEAPDPRWAGELAKLKNLLANQTVGV